MRPVRLAIMHSKRAVFRSVEPGYGLCDDSRLIPLLWLLTSAGDYYARQRTSNLKLQAHQ